MQTITREMQLYLEHKYMNSMPDAIYRREVEKAVLDPKFITALGLCSDQWISVTDPEKFFNDFYDLGITVLCLVTNIVSKKQWWEMYHAQMDNTGQLFYVDGSGDCGVDYKDVSYYRIETFPPLPHQHQNNLKR